MKPPSHPVPTEYHYAIFQFSGNQVRSDEKHEDFE